MTVPSKREPTSAPYIELRKDMAARSDKKWFSPSMHTIQERFTSLLSKDDLSETEKTDLQTRAIEIALEPESLTGFNKACSIAKNFFASGFTVWKDSATIRSEILSALEKKGIDVETLTQEIKTAKVERDLKELNTLITSHERDWISPSLYTLSEKLTELSQNANIDKSRLTPFATHIFLKPTSLSAFQKACSIARTFFSSRGTRFEDATAIREKLLETFKDNNVPFEIEGTSIVMTLTKPITKTEGTHRSSVQSDINRGVCLTIIDASGKEKMYERPLQADDLNAIETSLGDLLEFAHAGFASLFKEPITKEPSTLTIDYDSKKKNQSIKINPQTKTITMTYNAMLKDEDVEIAPCRVEGTLILQEDGNMKCTTKITLQS